MASQSKINRLYCRILAFAFGISLFPGFYQTAGAVTRQEMDQARAIAAKYYIRYVDDKSGYLDNWNPSSMSELEEKVTGEKDKELLSQFKKVAPASDYASWDKEKLVAYWSGTFFTENGSRLDSKGANNGLCKKEIKNAVSAMKVAAVAAPEAAPQETQEAAQEELPQADEALAGNIADQLEDVGQEIEEADSLMAEQEIEIPEEKPAKSGTWVYIMILAILIAVVIFLVVYASRTMKNQQKPSARESSRSRAEEENREEEFSPRPVAAPSLSEDTRMREKYAESLASKAEEIRSLTRQVSELEMLVSDLKEENRRLKADLERERRRRESDYAPVAARGGYEGETQEYNHGDSDASKEIFLGRVNSKGIFIRADRRPVDGQSVYVLKSINGTTGHFSIIDNRLVEERLLEEPGKWLAGGCFAKDIFDTEGRRGIVTEIPGRAVFSDGAWRVESKAKISYR